MKIVPFATEHFYAEYEFTTRYQLCNSDCETLTVEELLALAEIPFEDFGRLSLGYTESLGRPQLRAAIAETYAGVDADDVVVLSPAYDALINLFEHIVGTAQVHRLEFTPGDAQWELDLDRLRGLLSPKTKMIVVNFPHNPTGYLPTEDQLDELARIVEENGLILFCDEMYFGLVHSGTKSIRSAAEVTERAVVLSGLSKTHGLPGLRTGWLIVQDKILRQNIVNWKFYTSICPPAPSEFLALAAWKVRDRLRDRSVAQIERNLVLADAFFARWPDLFVWRRPMAGSTALVGMNVPSVTAYATQLAEKADILIQPAALLGSDDGHFRMGFGRAAFGVALDKFDAYLQAEHGYELAQE